MSYVKRLLRPRGLALSLSTILVALLFVAVGNIEMASAQGAKGAKGAAPAVKKAAPAGKKAAPAGKKAAPAAKKQPASTWVKICNKPKEGQPKGCITRSDIIEHEVMQVYGIVGVEAVEGKAEKTLIATLPYAVITPRKVINPKTKKEVTIPATLQFTWNIGAPVKAKIDSGKELTLKLLYCYRIGCVASMKINDAVIAELKKGKTISIIGQTFGRGGSGGRQIPLPVSLSGFGKALDGAPVDNKKYETFWNREITRRKLSQLSMQNKMLKEMQDKRRAAKAKAGKAKKAPVPKKK